MHCKHCGWLLKENDEFCSNCGAHNEAYVSNDNVVENSVTPIEIKKKKSFWKTYVKLLLVAFVWFVLFFIVGLIVGEEVSSLMWYKCLMMILPGVLVFLGWIGVLIYVKEK